MCLTLPGRVVALDKQWASVEIGGRVRRALNMLFPELTVGDWVVVSAGTILRVLDPDDAELIREALLAAGALDGPRPEAVSPT